MAAVATPRIPVASPDEAPWGPDWSAVEVITALEPMVSEARRQRLSEVLAARLESVTVLMDAPQDPHNMSAVLRSCDAFGVQTAHVVPQDDGFFVSRGVAKGTERWVDVATHPDPESALATLRGAGFQIVATHPQGRLDPPALAAIPRVALLLGNETRGISQDLSAAADTSVRIPMRGFVESLNVSVSAAILLQVACAGRAGDLPQATRQRLYARGLFRTVPRAEDVLAGLRERRSRRG